MGFIKVKNEKINFLAIKEWQEQNFIHGFVGKDLNLKTNLELSKAESFLSSLSGKEVYAELLEQIHCAEFIKVEQVKHYSQLPQSDGWFLNSENLSNHSYLIKTADCLPVILFHPQSKKRAILHCGWRGTFYGLLEKCIQEFIRLGCDSSEIEIAVGPGADSCCYEVRHDLSDLLVKELKTRGLSEYESKIVRVDESKTYISMPRFLKLQALAMKILERNIFLSQTCTICNMDYFSYRREKDKGGRQISFIL